MECFLAFFFKHFLERSHDFKVILLLFLSTPPFSMCIPICSVARLFDILPHCFLSPTCYGIYIYEPYSLKQWIICCFLSSICLPSLDCIVNPSRWKHWFFSGQTVHIIFEKSLSITAIQRLHWLVIVLLFHLSWILCIAGFCPEEPQQPRTPTLLFSNAGTSNTLRDLPTHSALHDVILQLPYVHSPFK